MEVILLEKIGTLGDIGTQVLVKPGFGRNYLIPKGKAVVANKKNIAIFEKRREELEARQNEKLDAAVVLAEQINALDITLERRASDTGKLFGSVSANDIVTVLKEHSITVEKASIKLPDGSIHTTGEHIVIITLHLEVEARLTLKITMSGPMEDADNKTH